MGFRALGLGLLELGFRALDLGLLGFRVWCFGRFAGRPEKRLPHRQLRRAVRHEMKKAPQAMAVQICPQTFKPKTLHDVFASAEVSSLSKP